MNYLMPILGNTSGWTTDGSTYIDQNGLAWPASEAIRMGIAPHIGAWLRPMGNPDAPHNPHAAHG